MDKSLEESLLLNGRWSSAEGCLCASAPAVTVNFNAKAAEIAFDIEGEARFRFDVDGKPAKTFETNERKTVKISKLPALGDGEMHSFRLVKISESNPGKICIRDISLGKGGSFGPAPKPSKRRIEFIGDSFTVGYGVEALGPEDGSVFEKTNTSKAYSFLLSDGFRADFQVNAVSGRGLVRNYDGIVPDWNLERLYDYTVAGSVESDANPERWDLQRFHPQVVVVFVGINDFQGNPPYAEVPAFKSAYTKLLDRLRAAHPGVKFLLVSTKTWPNDSLTPVVEEIFNEQKAAGHADLEYKLVYTENTALHGHPSEMSQKELANTLRPIIGRLGGWLSR